MNTSIWERDFHIHHCNIAIIGGGIIGCSIAKELSKIFPYKIYVFEKDKIGAGASSKNDGQCLMGGSESYDRMVGCYGREEAKRITQYKIDSVAKIKINTMKTGSFTWAIDSNEKEDLLASYELLKEDGFPVELIIEKKKIKHFSGSLKFKSGLYFPRDRSINPVKYLYKIRNEAALNGVKFVTGKEIVDINEDHIKDQFGNEIKFDVAIIATSWAATDLIPKLKDYMWAVRGQVLTTEKINLEGIADKFCHQTNHGYNYWKMYKDRIVLGGERLADETAEETDKIGNNEKIQGSLEGFMKDHWGIEPHIDYRWSGIMGNTKDGLPIIGSLSNMQNVILAAGMCGYGLSYSNSIANSVRNIIENGNYEMNDLLGTRRFSL